MGSTGEPERKRRHVSSISSPAKKTSFSPYSDDKKVQDLKETDLELKLFLDMYKRESSFFSRLCKGIPDAACSTDIIETANWELQQASTLEDIYNHKFTILDYHFFRSTMSLPRWKGKGFADIAQATPMSAIVHELKASLVQSEALAILTGCDVLLECGLDLAVLLSRTCFGQRLSTSEKDRQWFQLGPEEAFYLSHYLKCLTVVGEDGKTKTDVELWEHMTDQINEFPILYKAYSHLRTKNWVVRPGLQYGVDYVAYRHHPALVHSEYGVLVLSNVGADHPRLKLWSDWQCVLRVTVGVAKSLLVLSIKRDRSATSFSPSCLEKCTVEEHVITRWIPEESRERNNNSRDPNQSEGTSSHENGTKFKQETDRVDKTHD